jgi:uncharacterized membrane protein
MSGRTNLWLVPSLMLTGAIVVFVATQSLGRAQHAGAIDLPGWLDQGGAADARSLLAATAGAIITTLGLVLSITVLTLSIATSQFGQRCCKNTCATKQHSCASGLSRLLSSLACSH